MPLIDSCIYSLIPHPFPTIPPPYLPTVFPTVFPHYLPHYPPLSSPLSPSIPPFSPHYPLPLYPLLSSPPHTQESDSDCYSVSNPEECLEAIRELAVVKGGLVEGDEGEGRSRGRVYTELLDTEQSYVGDLQMVIDVRKIHTHCEYGCYTSSHPTYTHTPRPHTQSYYDAMNPDSVTIPLRLRGKRHVVFGNLLDIYAFHEK